MVIPAGGVMADPGDWELRSETVYSTGTFGSGVRTEVFYAPLEIRRKFEWGEIGLAVPYLWYRSNGNFTFIDTSGSPQLRSIPISGSASGLSDLLLDVQYRVLSQSGNQPEILLRGYWKPPTADNDKGLGSGSHDWILGTEFWSWFPESERWFYFGDLYRYFSGKQTGRQTRDSWIYDFGVGGLVAPQFLAKVSYREQTSTAPGLPTARSAELETEFTVNPKLKILSGCSVGLSDAAPDWTVMLGFEQSF